MQTIRRGAGLLSEISNDGTYGRLGVGQKDVRLNVVLQTLDCVFVFQLDIFQELSDYEVGRTV